MEDKLSKAILELVKVHDKRGGEIAEALGRIATQLKYLGNGNAMDGGMGAIEGLSVKINEGLESVSSAVGELSRSLDRQE